MTANPSKPKRHPLPRLWMQLADTLRLARRFEIRLEMSAEDALEHIHEIQELGQRDEASSIRYQVKAPIANQPQSFIVRRMRPIKEEEAFLKGSVLGEDNLLISYVSGKVYPSANNLFILAIIPPAFSCLFCVFWINFDSSFIEFEFKGLCGAFATLIAQALQVIHLFRERNALFNAFTHHLQTVASERVTTHDR
jgi:hypothetical protein